jgi:hypothetical protein
METTNVFFGLEGSRVMVTIFTLKKTVCQGTVSTALPIMEAHRRPDRRTTKQEEVGELPILLFDLHSQKQERWNQCLWARRVAAN